MNRVLLTLVGCIVFCGSPLRAQEYDVDGATELLYHFDESSGATVSDESDNELDGSASGTLVIDGRFGKSRRFNGSADVISVPDTDRFPFETKPFTVEGWFRFSSLQNHALISQEPASGSGSFWMFAFHNSDRTLRFEFSPDSASTHTPIAYSWNPASNIWYHLALSRSASGTYGLYINGILVRSGSNASPLPDVAGSLRVGNSVRSAFGLHGDVDDIRISSVTRTAGEFNLQLPPTNVSSTASGKNVTISWTSGGGGSTFLRYRVYRGSDSLRLALIDSTISTGIIDSTGAPSTSYTYAVTAVDVTGFESGRGRTSSVITGTGLPDAPILLAPSNSSTNHSSTVSFRWRSAGTSYHFQLGRDSTFVSGLVTEHTAVTDTFLTVTNLNGDTRFYWRARAKNTTGSGPWSHIWNFQTAARGSAPAVVTEPASPVGARSATLNAKVNPNGSTSSVKFEWGVTSSYGNSTPSVLVSASTELISIRDSLRNLTPSTTYHYRIVASNSFGTSFGDNVSFTTLSDGGAPSASTEPPTSVTERSAILNAVVDPNGRQTSVIFEWGKTTSYGNSTPPKLIPADAPPSTVSDTLKNLDPRTTYHVRVVANNALGTARGLNRTFVTTDEQTPPTVPTQLTPSNNAVNLTPTVSLRWRKSLRTDRYHAQLSTDALFGGGMALNDSTISDSLKSVSGLMNQRIYYWRVRAGNAAGWSAWSTVWQFATQPDPSTKRFVIPLRARDRNGATDTLYFGNAVGATYCIDPVFGEFELSAPSGFDARFIDHRSGSGACLGRGISVQYQDWLPQATRDTFVIALQSAGNGYPVKFSWPSDVTRYFSSLVMRDQSGGTFFEVNMLTKTSADLSNTLVTRLVIIGTTAPADSQYLTRNVTFTTIPSGRSVSVDSVSYVAPRTFSFNQGSVHHITVTSPQESTATLRYVWKRWSDGGTLSHSITVQSDSTITASFDKEYFLEMKTDSGGTLTPSSAWNTEKSSVQIRATASAGFTFDSWVGTGSGSYTGRNNPTTVVMNAPIVQRAIFKQQLPEKPVQDSPQDESTDQPRSLWLRWREVDHASGYGVQVATSQTFAQGVFLNDTAVTGTARAANNLTAGTRYYWRVRSKNSSGWSAWSETWRFTTSLDYVGEYRSDAATGLLYHLNESVGSVVKDAGPYGNDGVALGSAVAVGRFGNSRSFTFPSLHYISVPATPSLKPTGNFTVECWVQPAFRDYQKAGSQSPVILSAGGYHLGIQTSGSSQSGVFHFTTKTTSGISTVVSRTQIDSSAWYHLAGVYTTDGADMMLRLYVNGELESSTYVPGAGIAYGAASELVCVANSPGDQDMAHQFWGRVEEVRISNDIRLPEQFSLQLAPRNLAAQASGQRIGLQWINSGGIGLLRNRIYRGLDSLRLSIIDSTSASSYTDTSGSSSTTYFYRVAAVDFTGFASRMSVAVSGTTGEGKPIVRTQAPSEVRENSALLQATVDPFGRATVVRFVFGYNQGYSDSVTANESPVNGTGEVIVTARVNQLLPGTTYHFSVVAENSTGRTMGADQTFSTPLPPYPSTYNLSHTYAFPSRSQASAYTAKDYRLIGLPGAAASSVSQIISGTAGTDWQMYWDNGAASAYLIRYNPEAPFNFAQGRGFWFLSKGPAAIQTSVTTATLDSGQSTDISLHPGWNVITNPFTHVIPWSVIQTANGITEPIHTYKGSYSISDNLVPYEGFYLFNSQNKPTLKIPYADGSSGQSIPVDIPSSDWSISIYAKSESIESSRLTLGIVENAENGFDRYDVRKPRSMDAGLDLSMVRQEWDDAYPDFSADMRYSLGEIEKWGLTAAGSSRERSAMVVEGIDEVPPEYDVILWDQETGIAWDLRRDGKYGFYADGTSRDFEVWIGRESALRKVLGGLRPKEFALEANYPNPFNNSTMFVVKLPREEKITLSIFNMLGQEIATIFSGLKEEGIHLFEWNGRNSSGASASSGMYYGRLTGENGKQSGRKILLLK